ncbi:MAG: hypothetical protein ACR2KP_22035, partial [Egibacteraceae bacterium]
MDRGQRRLRRRHRHGYTTLLAAVGDVAHPAWRGAAVGVYRFWRDIGFAVGAVLLADAHGMTTAILIVAAITAASGDDSGLPRDLMTHRLAPSPTPGRGSRPPTRAEHRRGRVRSSGLVVGLQLHHAVDVPLVQQQPCALTVGYRGHLSP